MNSFVKILILCLLLLSGAIAVRSELKPLQSGFWGDFDHIPFAILATLTLVSAYIDFTTFKKKKCLFYLFPSILGLVLTLLVTYKIWERRSINHSKTILTLTTFPSINGGNEFIFEFKNKDNIRFIETSTMGNTIYYGKYRRIKDTIKIIQMLQQPFLIDRFPTTGLLRNDTCFWNNGFDTMIVVQNN